MEFLWILSNAVLKMSWVPGPPADEEGRDLLGTRKRTLAFTVEVCQ